MGQFSVKTYNPPGSLLSATQQHQPHSFDEGFLSNGIGKIGLLLSGDLRGLWEHPRRHRTAAVNFECLR